MHGVVYLLTGEKREMRQIKQNRLNTMLSRPNKRGDNKNRTPTSPSSVACICGLPIYSDLQSYNSRMSIHLKEVRKS